MRKSSLAPAIVAAAALALSPCRPADAQVSPLTTLLIVGGASVGMWVGIIYFFNVIGPDKCMFQSSANKYYDLGGYLNGGGFATVTELCGAAMIDVNSTLNSSESTALLVVQPNPNLGWKFKASFPHTGCVNSFGSQLSVEINAFYTCLNSGQFQNSHPIYVLGENGSTPPSGATTYNWSSAGNLGSGQYGWTR